jgi:hypothetical protein
VDDWERLVERFEHRQGWHNLLQLGWHRLRQSPHGMGKRGDTTMRLELQLIRCLVSERKGRMERVRS